MSFGGIASVIQNIRIQDIADIGIISVFIYLMLVWFRKSRARFMLIGMIILSLIYILARVFGLYLTTMAFQAFFAIFLIAIVVIFQDDIRYFFERVALWGINRRFVGRVILDQNTGNLISAIVNLSRKKIGALIVVKGIDPLDRYIEAGTAIDALVGQDILESIFDPHVPTHDGAVIMDGNRLTKFGCHLPLSANLRAASHFGTRHAAALGLAERSDALCIVISEERGSISLAEGGRFFELRDAAQLQDILDAFYRKRFPVKKRMLSKRFLTSHWIEKIIAVILASGLWFFLGHRTDIIRRDFVVPVEYRNLSSDKIIGGAKPREVMVTLSGSERAFDLLKPGELKLSLDMATFKEGERNIAITKDLLNIPSGISFVNTQPSEIDLKILRLIKYTAAVSIETKGSPPRGFMLKRISVEPKDVLVVAPSSFSKDMIKVSTDLIDLRLIKDGATLTSRLVLAPGLILGDTQPAEVKVTIEVKKK